MAKYLTEFNTYAEYQAATLNLPNVSLIKSTGKVYYKNIFAGASLGDILMWDNVNNKLVTTIGGNWNTTMYPIAQYEPIAINIYPADQTSDGKSRWLSLKWVDKNNSSGNYNVQTYKWGLTSQTISTDVTLFNGRENTNSILNLQDTNNVVFNAVNIFYTSGTQAGDWYLPSYKELSLYASNFADINTKIGATNLSSTSGRLWTSTTVASDTSNAYMLSSGKLLMRLKTQDAEGARAMLSL